MVERQPNLFIPGAPKCGTTSLAAWLGRHPQVYLGPVKEPHHYNTDEKQVFYADRDDYLALYNHCSEQHRYRLDASVWYLHSRVAVSNILADCPAARFIVCLRNPVDMAFSLHGQFLNKSYREHIASFERAWELGDERMHGRAVSRRVTDPRYLAYKYSCQIGSQCKSLLDQIDRRQVYFVVLDDLMQNQAETLKGVLDFLGLESKAPLVLPRENARTDVRLVRAQRLMQDLLDIKQRLGMGRLSFGLYRRFNSLNAMSTPRRMDPATRRRLTLYFREEIELIWEMVGRRYEGWVSCLDECKPLNA